MLMDCDCLGTIRTTICTGGTRSKTSMRSAAGSSPESRIWASGTGTTYRYSTTRDASHPTGNPQPVEVADESYLAFTATGSDRVRVSVVAETGDVYALRFKTGEAALLGNVGVTDPERGLSNSRERSPVYIQADVLIEDFTEESGPLGRPLSWFVNRLGTGSS